MRKLFLMVLAIAAVMTFGAGSASASGGGDDGGKPCPPNSPAGQQGGNHNPGCGHGNRCKDQNKNDKKKCPPGQGCKKYCPPPCEPNCPPPPKPPEGNCELADRVLLGEDAKLVCLYFADNADNADKAKDCPDAEIALPVNPVVGACVFLPPEGAEEGGPAIPGLPEL